MRTFLSYDAPQRGANIPLGLQYWVDFFSGQSADAAYFRDRLNTPAARQMLRLPLHDATGGDAAARSAARGARGRPRGGRRLPDAPEAGRVLERQRRRARPGLRGGSAADLVQLQQRAGRDRRQRLGDARGVADTVFDGRIRIPSSPTRGAR